MPHIVVGHLIAIVFMVLIDQCCGFSIFAGYRSVLECVGIL